MKLRYIPKVETKEDFSQSKLPKYGRNFFHSEVGPAFVNKYYKNYWLGDHCIWTEDK